MTTRDVCVICGQPVVWHFDKGRKLSCSEAVIRITGKIPKWKSCRMAMSAYAKAGVKVRKP